MAPRDQKGRSTSEVMKFPPILVSQDRVSPGCRPPSGSLAGLGSHNEAPWHSKLRETERVYPRHGPLTATHSPKESLLTILQDPDLDLRRGRDLNVPCRSATMGPSFMGNYVLSVS